MVYCNMRVFLEMTIRVLSISAQTNPKSGLGEKKVI